jgi:outer membrane murein-binding lipoprotein Lpp
VNFDLGALLLGGGGGTVLYAVVNAILTRRKLGADTAQVLSKAAIDLVDPLSKRIHELEREVDELRRKVRATTAELDACRDLGRRKDAELERLRGR